MRSSTSHKQLLCFDLSVNELIVGFKIVNGMLGSRTDGANLMDDLGRYCYARVGYRMTVLRHGNASI